MRDADLFLVFSFLVRVGDLALFVTLKKEHLSDSLLEYIFAGMGVVFEISSVTYPSHSGSKGVTFTIVPHLR